MKIKKKEEVKNFLWRPSQEVHQRLKEEAEDKGISMSLHLSDIVDAHFKSQRTAPQTDAEKIERIKELLLKGE